ncbi:MAG: hypothetical protein M9951_20120 [Burkholderiaceae bacterium]|nr:hypothetical protein [Burkholderiaceae bacterium]
MSNTHTPDRQRAASARGPASSATPLFAVRSRLIHDWATRVLREEDREEVLAVLEWLAVHGDRNYLGALAIVSHRFPGDVAVAAAAEAVVARIGVR